MLVGPVDQFHTYDEGLPRHHAPHDHEPIHVLEHGPRPARNDRKLLVIGGAYSKAVNGFPGLEGAEALAAGYAARHASADAAVAALIKWQTGMASVAGFLTGCGGFVALPVAMPANLASALYIQVRLIAAIAHHDGHAAAHEIEGNLVDLLQPVSGVAGLFGAIEPLGLLQGGVGRKPDGLVEKENAVDAAAQERRRS